MRPPHDVTLRAQEPAGISRSSLVVAGVGCGVLGIAIGVLSTLAVLSGRATSRVGQPVVGTSQPIAPPTGQFLGQPEPAVPIAPEPAREGEQVNPDSKVDVSAFLPVARSRAPQGSSFSKLRVHLVGASGVVDLGAPSYKASVMVRFRLPPVPAVQKPGAPPGVMVPAKYFPDTVIRLEGSVQTTSQDPFGGMGMGAKAEPHCTVKEVWRGAIAAGAPADAVADVTFPSDLRPTAWNFYVDGAKFNVLVDDATCAVPKQRGDLESPF